MAPLQNHHPLPPPPGQQIPGTQESAYQAVQHSQQSTPKKDKRSRGLSFKSERSAGSKENKENRENKENKAYLDPVETHREKAAKRLYSKADPTMALNEVEPGVVAAQAVQTMDSLRTLQHTDLAGNIITDPDKSNPTRWRLERPLDTIRSFEDSIRKRDRNSMMPFGDNESVRSYGNRNSFYAAQNNQNRFQHASYYSDYRNSRPMSGAWDYQQQQGRWGPPPDRRRYHPGQGEPQYNPRTPGGNGILYSGPNAPGDQRSYGTPASGSGTSGERPGYVTDPTSSENSSIDRRPSPQKRQPEPVNDYGVGFSDQLYKSSTFTVTSSEPTPQGSQPGGTASMVPKKRVSILRRSVQAAPDQDGKKRKSWFGLKGNKN